MCGAGTGTLTRQYGLGLYRASKQDNKTCLTCTLVFPQTEDLSVQVSRATCMRSGLGWNVAQRSLHIQKMHIIGVRPHVLHGVNAFAGVIMFTNFGPDMTYDGTGWNVDAKTPSGLPQTVAMGFTPSISAPFQDAILPIDGINGVSIFLETDVSGRPGVILEHFDLPGSVGLASPHLIVVNSLINPFLVAGTPYWIVAAPLTASSTLVWHWSTNDLGGPEAFSTVAGPAGPWTTQTFERSAFQIDGTGTVPEPATALLLASGLVVVSDVGRYSRRFRRS
jgi:hypothetical protein